MTTTLYSLLELKYQTAFCRFSLNATFYWKLLPIIYKAILYYRVKKWVNFFPLTCEQAMLSSLLSLQHVLPFSLLFPWGLQLSHNCHCSWKPQKALCKCAPNNVSFKSLRYIDKSYIWLNLEINWAQIKDPLPTAPNASWLLSCLVNTGCKVKWCIWALSTAACGSLNSKSLLT